MNNIDLLSIEELEYQRKTALRAAKELCYSEQSIRRIKEATSELEIDNILYDERNVDWLEEGRRSGCINSFRKGFKYG